MDIIYTIGIPEEYREEAAKLYDEAFGEKFSVAVSDPSIRVRLLAASFRLDSAICSIKEKELIGLVDFQTPNGSLTGGMTNGFRSGELVMDGIAVRSNARGSGVGTKLLSMLRDFGIREGYPSIRLDVIDRNKGAQNLYTRFGSWRIGTKKVILTLCVVSTSDVLVIYILWRTFVSCVLGR